MIAVESRQAVYANNIANGATTGFRRQEPAQKGFYDIFVEKSVRPSRFNRDPAPGGGVKIAETFTDTTGGALTTTDNPFNVGLSGPGFLVVNTPKGDRYTRSGELAMDTNGQLVTKDGFLVQGDGGSAITVGNGQLTIGTDGTVSSGGVNSGRLRVVEFEDPHMLTREGEGFYVASDAAQQRSAEAQKTTVLQNTLEASNVNMPREMIGMILGLRAYEANERVIRAIDETMNRVIQDVGMPV
jgi:flagellar basal-body rod protein FlgF